MTQSFHREIHRIHRHLWKRGRMAFLSLRVGVTTGPRKKKSTNAHAQSQQQYKAIKNLSSSLVVAAPVQSVENTRTAMARKAAASDGALCATCGNARWWHYNRNGHPFKKGVQA